MAAVELVEIPNDGQYHSVMTVICEDGHVVGQWLDSITEKYPFFCPECDDMVNTGKYPWSLASQVVKGSGQVAVIDSPTRVEPDNG